MIVRAESASDREAVATVDEEAFGRPEEAALVAAVRLSDRFVPELSLVAETGGLVVGHVLLSYVDLDLGGTRVLQVAPLAVRPSHQRRGIGTALMEEALHRADERGEPFVLLEGNPAYYSRFGFGPSVERGIEPPAGVPTHVFMIRPLRNYDPTLRGRVVYPEAFAVVA